MKIFNLAILTFLASSRATPVGDQGTLDVDRDRDKVETLVAAFVKQRSHLSDDDVEGFASGLAKLTDSAVASVAKMEHASSSSSAAPVVDSFIDSLSKGTSYLVSALASNPNGLRSHLEINELIASLQRLSQAVGQQELNTHEIDSVVSELSTVNSNLVVRGTSTRLFPRQDLLTDAIQTAINELENSIQTLVNDLNSGDGTPITDILKTVITGLDSQIDNVINLFATALNSDTFGISGAIGSIILSPAIQSVTDGAEVIVSNLVGGVIDGVCGPFIEPLIGSMNSLVKLGTKQNVKSTPQLAKAVNQLSEVNDSYMATASSVQRAPTSTSRTSSAKRTSSSRTSSSRTSSRTSSHTSTTPRAAAQTHLSTTQRNNGAHFTLTFHRATRPTHRPTN